MVDGIVRLLGIIPAYAGSTVSEHSIAAVTGGSSPHTRGALKMADCHIVETRDHPRIRGEHRRSCMVYFLMMRIIPAYAGSTETDR